MAELETALETLSTIIDVSVSSGDSEPTSTRLMGESRLHREKLSDSEVGPEKCAEFLLVAALA